MMELTKNSFARGLLTKYKTNARSKFIPTTKGITRKIPIETLGSGSIWLTQSQISIKSIIVRISNFVNNFISCCFDFTMENGI